MALLYFQGDGNVAVLFDPSGHEIARGHIEADTSGSVMDGERVPLRFVADSVSAPKEPSE